MSRQWWFTTDWHFNHKIMAERHRPANYEKLIIDGVKRLVKPDDVLVCLGDVVLGSNAGWHESVLKSLSGRKILVKGNHDRGSDNWYLDHGWDFVCRNFQLKRYDKRWLFSHEPQHYFGSGWDINVHGHLHNDGHRMDEVKGILTHRFHFLLSLEKDGYEPKSFDWLNEHVEEQVKKSEFTNGMNESKPKESTNRANESGNENSHATGTSHGG